jgi:predicted hotdog family 3-hydroxylacyl-ACP dehydratase
MMTLPLSHQTIEQIIPHAGSMCLLDQVISFEKENIHCSTFSHRSANNPLKIEGKLHAIHGVEYASQAVALHNALTQNVVDTPRIGYLAGLRDLQLSVKRLDSLQNEINVYCQKLIELPTGVLYTIKLDSGGCVLLEGKILIILEQSNGNIK